MRIPQFAPCLGKEELKHLTDCIDANWITAGNKVKQFEAAVATKHEVNHAVAMCNGTLALWAILQAISIRGQEVIIPDFTFVASAGAISWAGGIPVFADINKDTLQIDPQSVEKLISSNTIAIMPVNIFGKNYDVEAIQKIATNYNLLIIEDAAQSFGVSYKGKMAGTFGIASMISFYGDKVITSAEGGMVLTNDDALYNKVLRLKNQGNLKTGSYINETLGLNLRMSDLHAAVGLGQLEKFNWIVKRKLEVYHRYKACGVKLLPIEDGEIPFRVVTFVNDAEAMRLEMIMHDIECRRVFYPLHLQPHYKNESVCPNTVWVYEHGLALPSSVLLKDEEIEEVSGVLNSQC
jgi:perosamine synthetase